MKLFACVCFGDGDFGTFLEKVPPYYHYEITGLQGISRDLYEATNIEGANFFDKFRFIILPLLKFFICE